MKIRHYLRSLCPDYWIQVYPLNKAWDRELRELLTTQNFRNIGSYTAEIGPYNVWIENYPYASFTPHNPSGWHTDPTYRPRRATIAWAWEKLAEDALKQIKASPKV